MANGADTDEYVVLSRVRPGLKRELAFALKSRAEYASSIGRTRSRRSPSLSPCNGASMDSTSNKRFKSSDSMVVKIEKHPVDDQLIEKLMDDDAVRSEEEPKSDVVDLASDDEQKSVLVESAFKEVEPKVEPKVEDEPEPLPCNGGVVEKGFSVYPTKRVTRSAAKVMEESLERSTTKDVKIEGSESDGVSKLEMKMSKKIDVMDLASDDVQKSVLVESAFKEVEPKGQDESETPPCNGVVVEKDCYEYPTKRVTRSAMKVMGELLERSATADVKTEGSESDGVSKLEMKMSKKIELKRFPTKLKDLLDTGLLEGLRVRYLRGTKARVPLDTGLPGIIKGSGILCSCDMCGGTQVVTPNQFELHAASSNKRPPEYIYLENGKTLRDVLNACKDAPFESLEVTIQNVIGCSSEHKPAFCLNCKGSIPEAATGRTMLLCNSCMILKESQPSPAYSERSPTTISIPKSSDSSRSKTQGRLTRKDLRLHKLVFQNDVLADGTALAYFARGQKFLDGYKKGFGIFCYCCQSEVSPSQFEAHAGFASRRKPYLHIYTSNGVSLHELSINLSKERKLSAEENDDLCSICADGGDLLCCDTCPRAFHTDCISLPIVPGGTWYCKYCQNMFQKEKFVERNANAVAAGRIIGIDPMEQITNRCIRIVETAETDVGGCALCRSHDFSKTFGSRTVIFCDQCEKEYHVGCLKEHGMDDLKELPKGRWFCCMGCNRIHSALQKLVVSGEEKLPESLLNVIKKKLEEKGCDSGADLDIRWRLLSGKMASDEAIQKEASDETRLLLSKAVSIFHDQFDPIAYSNTGRVDLIPHMVYGRNVRDQEFGGMYCAILSVNSTIVSAGIIRIFGEAVAELPLVATSTDCQGQGYFQTLFSCIENLLGFLNVRNIVLPAADEAESIWTNRFGFKKVLEDELMNYRKDYHQLMIFQGTSMLHKSVVRSSNIS